MEFFTLFLRKIPVLTILGIISKSKCPFLSELLPSVSAHKDVHKANTLLPSLSNTLYDPHNLKYKLPMCTLRHTHFPSKTLDTQIEDFKFNSGIGNIT